MQNKGLTYCDSRIGRLKVSLTAFHLVFLAIVLFEAPWKSEYYEGQIDLMVGETLALYVFYALPFAIWHAGDAIQRHPFTSTFVSLLTNFRLALFCFVAKMLWGLAYAIDLVDVPGAHEFGTLNYHGVHISLGLLYLAAFVSLAKFVAGVFSRLRKAEQ